MSCNDVPDKARHVLGAVFDVVVPGATLDVNQLVHFRHSLRVPPYLGLFEQKLYHRYITFIAKFVYVSTTQLAIRYLHYLN